jgi:hypothetical protein
MGYSCSPTEPERTMADAEDEHFELTQQISKLEDATRHIGLYLEQAGILQNEDGHEVIVASFTINKVAFSERVQNPDRHSVDTEFKNLQTGMAKDDFLDVRSRIAEALERGEDPFAGEDEDDQVEE